MRKKVAVLLALAACAPTATIQNTHVAPRRVLVIADKATPRVVSQNNAGVGVGVGFYGMMGGNTSGGVSTSVGNEPERRRLPQSVEEWDFSNTLENECAAAMQGSWEVVTSSQILNTTEWTVVMNTVASRRNADEARAVLRDKQVDQILRLKTNRVGLDGNNRAADYVVDVTATLLPVGNSSKTIWKRKADSDKRPGANQEKMDFKNQSSRSPAEIRELLMERTRFVCRELAKNKP